MTKKNIRIYGPYDSDGRSVCMIYDKDENKTIVKSKAELLELIGKLIEGFR